MNVSRGWVVCVMSAVILHIAAVNYSDSFQQVLDGMTDPQLKEKLIDFQEQGIERSISNTPDVEAVVQYAESLLGTPHKMGGVSSAGLDCSGLVRLAHLPLNIDLPHSSHEQARYGKVIPPGQELRRGDLVFFHTTYKTTRLVTHSGIYLGDDKFIHTSVSKGVSVSNLNGSDYWKRHYLFATRLTD